MKIVSTTISCLFSIALFAIPGLATDVAADAELNPNQISGTVSFTNRNSTIRNILSAQGVESAFVKADSIDITPPLNNSTFLRPDDGREFSYQMTVESSENGISYKVHADLRMDNNKERYLVSSVNSNPVFPEPSADVEVNLEQCAALADVRFVDSEGQPINVSGGYMVAWRNVNGRKVLQAQDFDMGSGISQDYLALHGDSSTYSMQIVYDFGTDFYDDKIRNLCQVEFTASCDEIIPVECATGGESLALGKIIGNVSVAGETLLDHAYLTRMVAENGPFQNRRYGDVPGAGAYELKNLVPSSVVDPDLGYMVYGHVGFGEGYDFQMLRTPILLDRVIVPEAGTVDLGDTFAISPGYMTGNIELLGPVSATSALKNLRRDVDQGYDYDEDNLPNNVYISYSHIGAYGSFQRAEGAERSAGGGIARGIFKGAYDSENGKFSGDYRLAMGGLDGENSIWSLDHLALTFNNIRTRQENDPYHNASLWIKDKQVGEREIEAGASHDIDQAYCFNEVQLAYSSTSGVFYRPRLRGNGSFTGENYQERLVDYNVSVKFAQGLPSNKNTAAASGMVSLDLPQGNYNISPSVTAVNPDGSETNTELPQISIEVGCGQVIRASTEIQVSAGDVPQTVNENEITIEGTINTNNPVDSIHYSKNTQDPVLVCDDNCAPEGEFSATVPLDEGENNITVTATTEDGSQASVSVTVNYEQPVELTPITLSQCNDITKVASNGISSAVSFAPVATGGCSTPEISCDVDSGSLFVKGNHKATCSAVDECQQQARCEFYVNITDRFYSAHEHVLPEVPEAEAEPDPQTEGHGHGDDFLHVHVQRLMSMGIPQCAIWNDQENFPTEKCEADKSSPVLSVANSFSTLTDKGENLIPVGHVVKVNHCQENIENTLETRVYSDESNAGSDGNSKTGVDATMTDDGLALRARSTGNGRVYLIINEVTDEQGEKHFSCSSVSVPSDNSAASLGSVLTESRKAVAHCNQTGEAPSNFMQQGQSENLAPQTIERTQAKTNSVIDPDVLSSQTEVELVIESNTSSGGSNSSSGNTSSDNNSNDNTTVSVRIISETNTSSNNSDSSSSSGGSLSLGMLLMLFTTILLRNKKVTARP